MQKDQRLSREEIIYLFQDDAMQLLQYYSWIKKMSGTQTGAFYKGDDIEKNSMAVPVYDSTLLNFIKTAKGTEFMNRNYVYTFSRYRLKTPEDEIRLISTCTLQDIRVIGDILSMYCYKGDVKSAIWTDGLKNGVYLAILNKLKELLEIRKPLA